MVVSPTGWLALRWWQGVARSAQICIRLDVEEMPKPDVDFYDAGPIALSATPIQKVSAQEAAPADDEGGLKASRRLKTDIRRSSRH
jgi:hypothetical protein